MLTEPAQSFAERMSVLIESVGGPGELARRAGLSRRVIDKYRAGESEPSRDRLVALASAADVDVAWLATGRASRPPISSQPEQARPLFAQIPRYDLRLGGGGGAFNERAQLLDHIPFTQEFLTKKLGRTSTEGLLMVEVRGDSMEPTIGDGDLVLVDQNQRDPEDGIMAIVMDDMAYVKRIRHFFDGLEIISDNRDVYPPIQLPRDRLADLQIIGRVRWCGRVFGR